MGETRFDREARLPGWDVERLAASQVVVVGVGALGNEVARLLASSGCGRLVLCDPDVVEWSNLPRAPLFSEHDVGLPKAEVAAGTLRRLAPDAEVVARTEPLLSGVGLAELREADLVVSCLDSIRARIDLSSRCSLAGRGLLDAGTAAWGGQVRRYPAGGACYACGLTPAELAEADDVWSCAGPPRDVPQAASAANGAVVGALQALVAVRSLLGLPVPATELLVGPLGLVAAGAPLGVADPACPYHDLLDDHPVERLPVHVDDPVVALLRCLRPDETVLHWGGAPGRVTDPRVLNEPAHAGRTLREMCVAPREILPVCAPGTDEVRFVELTDHVDG